MDAQLTPGLPDDAYAHDGLITKRPIRAYALAMLAPRGGEHLWDLGAGSGSISVEWCRAHPHNTASAVERDATRAARIATNAAACGASGRIGVTVAALEDALATLPPPQAVFVGGGLSAAVLDAAWDALVASGRLVAHSVTLESDAVLADAHARWGGELVRLGVETAERLGRFTAYAPARTVTCWAQTKS